MAVASEHPISAPSRASRATWLERAILVLGVCLPVPVFAGTGLAIPLPAAVERMAAAVVPFADVAAVQTTEALARGTRGSIMPAPGERASDRAANATGADPATGVHKDRRAPTATGKPLPDAKHEEEASGRSPLTPTPTAPTPATDTDEPAQDERPDPEPTREEPAPTPAKEEPEPSPKPSPPPPPPPAREPPPPPPPPVPLPPPPPPPRPRPVEDPVDKVPVKPPPAVEEPVKDLLPPELEGAVDGLLPGTG